MTMARMLTIDELSIDEADWNEPGVLDGILLGKRLIRSDPGMPAERNIIVADVTDDDMPTLEEVGAALALQRAVICVMTSEIPHSSIETIQEIVSRVETRSDLHDVLLAAELFRCQRTGLIAQPPELIYKYKDGTVPGLLRRALDAMDQRSYGMESVAVANSLCTTVDLLDRINLTKPMETRPATAQDEQPAHYPLQIRNNLAWLANNLNASDERTTRYLSVYGTNIDGLAKAIASYS